MRGVRGGSYVVKGSVLLHEQDNMLNVLERAGLGQGGRSSQGPRDAHLGK